MMKVSDQYGIPAICVQHPDGTRSILDLTSVDTPKTPRVVLGKMIIAGREHECYELVSRLNDISEKYLGATFVLPGDELSFCASDLGATVLQALQNGRTFCAPWNELFRSHAGRLSNPQYWQRLIDPNHNG